MTNITGKEELRQKKANYEWIKKRLAILEGKPIARFYYGLIIKYIAPAQHRNFTNFFINQNFGEPTVIRTMKYTAGMMMALEEKDELEMYAKISNIMDEISSLRLERGEAEIIIENVIRTVERFAIYGKDIRSILFEGVTRGIQEELTKYIEVADEVLGATRAEELLGASSPGMKV